MIDGPVRATDLDKTDANKKLVAAFVDVMAAPLKPGRAPRASALHL
jgi:hypothetical protein